MARVWVNVTGYVLPEGEVFVQHDFEEYDFVLGRGHEAVGLQMVATSMVVGERAAIYCGEKFGYSDLQRPKGVPDKAPLLFVVELLRFEEERKSSTSMELIDKMKYVLKRRRLGNELYKQGKFKSARKQYETALRFIEEAMADADLHNRPLAQQPDMQGMFPQPPSSKDNKDEDGEEEDEEFSELVEPDSFEYKKMWVDEQQRLLWMNAAQCNFKIGSMPDTIAQCSLLLREDPEHPKALFRRAEAYRLNNDPEEAVRDYEALLRLKPGVLDEQLIQVIQQRLVKQRKAKAVLAKKQQKQFSKVFAANQRNFLYDDKPSPRASEDDDSAIPLLKPSSWPVLSLSAAWNTCSRMANWFRSWCERSARSAAAAAIKAERNRFKPMKTD
eukprot:TRINITY_DN84170_c0_g1_i1.p1 TRINITY_DN84170_c0_g1~~TRINITY_DN84170_c0_g1_i1.p1  ORF type:complete len:451 (+),score=221.76 TRINITY_DN84170_c0_g1_i1:197-1354(+)